MAARVKAETNIRVVREEDVNAFYRHVYPYLMRQEAEHNLMLGLLETQIRGHMTTPFAYLGYAERDGEVLAALTRMPDYRFLISCAADRDAVKALVYDAVSLMPDAGGVTGPKEEADRFAGVWCVRQGGTTQLNRAERIYRLDKLVPAGMVEGQARWATGDDLQLVKDWWVSFIIEADPFLANTPRDEVAKNINPRVDQPQDVRGIWLWEVDGQPVSMVGYAGPTPNSIRIAPVYTPPEHRGRGYASALCSAVAAWLLDRENGLGKQFLTLFTDLANPTSNHIYQSIGFTPVIDVSEHNFTLMQTSAQKEG